MLALFALALMVRLPGLAGFITADEHKWIDRSRWFAVGLLFPEVECPPVEYGREAPAQGLACTLQIGYPGVTTMWAGSAGLLVHYWRTAWPEVDLQSFLDQIPRFTGDPALIAPARRPFAIIDALFVPLLYFLVRRLFNGPIALIATLLVAMHPYQIALSRVVHHDMFNTMFMMLSLLALIGYWLRGWRWYWLLISALLGGLALLSKQVSWFLPPFVAVLAGMTWLVRLWPSPQLSSRGSVRHAAAPIQTAARLTGEGLLWGAVAALTFVALFPAMWVIPLETLQTVFVNSTRLVEEGHTHYLLGEVSDDPGPLFYPLGWLLRATLFEVVGLAGALLAAGSAVIRRRSAGKWLRTHPAEAALLLYVGLLLVFVTISDKKMVRYFLPAFPALDIFAAMGLLYLVHLPARWLGLARASMGTRSHEQRAGRPQFLLPLLIAALLLANGWSVLSHYPYYLTYHNPLLGGTPGAARLMTIIGWGEGLNEAAAFLNQQPDAQAARIVNERACTMLKPFAVGEVFCLNSSVGGTMQADYYVYYYNVVQREMPWPEQWAYYAHHREPLHRVTLHGLDYVLIYKNPVRYQVDREANALPGLFKVFGYDLGDNDRLTLFWQNLGLDQQELWIGLAPTRGVYPVRAGAVDRERVWLRCMPKPTFAAALNRPNAIIESVCPLDEVDLPPGLYDVQLGVGGESGVTAVETSRLAVLQVDQSGQVEQVALREY